MIDTETPRINIQCKSIIQVERIECEKNLKLYAV